MTDTRRARRRVFLGGYVNDTNAQNLNCRALARYLDPTRYEVGCLSVYSGDLDTPDSIDHVFQSNWPNRLTAPLAYVRGLLWSDIAYLPHRRFLSILQPLARLLRRPLFTTVEGLLDGPNIASGVAVFGSRATLLESYRGFSACYAITRAVAEYNRQHLGISTDPDHLLQLGVDHAVHSKPTDPKRGLQSVLFVGRLIERKGIFEVIELARRRPGLSVHIAGDGEAVQMVAAAARSLPNLRVHGLLPQNQIADLMSDVDLLLLPSRSEGFPRVVLEAACAGVPSILYPDYGAADWLQDGTSGFIVNDVDDLITRIDALTANPGELTRAKRGALELAARFDWRVIIKDWEREIERMLSPRHASG